MKTFLFTLLVVLPLACISGCNGNGETAARAEPDQAAAAPAEVSADLCVAHGSPADLCFLCDPALRDSGRLWCKEHARYEDRCWLCHPELRDPDRAYCEEHGLYEDECILCDPSRGAAATSSALGGEADSEAGGLYCAEHDVHESECGICHLDLAAGLEPGGELLIRLPSARSAELVGVEHGAPRAGTTAGSIDAYAEVDYDRNRLAQITPRVAGVVEQVLVDVGDQVTAGQPLVELASAELAAAKQAFLDARLELDLRRQEADRARRLREQEIGSERDLQAATAAQARAAARAEAAGQNLRNLGLDQAAVRRVAEESDTTARLTVRAPFAGEVIARTAVLGESVAADAALLRVADLSRMWIELSLPQSSLAVVEPGLPVVARFDALPDREIHGELIWIAAGLDERTRLIQARAEAPNPDGRLKAGLYGRATVRLNGGTDAPAVPHDAIYDLQNNPFVLVPREEGLYALRRVALGPRQGDRVAILAGLDAHESVVTGSGFSIFSELLKSQFGAGCAEH
ncbi:MAG: efflux RND transporter periplasmic adaptor subunit [Candidatus Krumholzibacteriia bacterium]